MDILAILAILAILRQLYEFVQHSNQVQTRLWPEAAMEAGWLLAIIPFCFASMKAEWNPLISISDASLLGFAVGSLPADAAVAASLGVVRERDRYRVRAPPSCTS